MDFVFFLLRKYQFIFLSFWRFWGYEEQTPLYHAVPAPQAVSVPPPQLFNQSTATGIVTVLSS